MKVARALFSCLEYLGLTSLQCSCGWLHAQIQMSHFPGIHQPRNGHENLAQNCTCGRVHNIMVTTLTSSPSRIAQCQTK